MRLRQIFPMIFARKYRRHYALLGSGPQRVELVNNANDDGDDDDGDDDAHGEW